MKTLFITYNGATEPLIRSQGIPYLKGLSRAGIGCILLSFEKPGVDKASAAALERELKGSDIGWKKLRYHKSPSLPATVFDILIGIIAGIWITLSRHIDVIHARATVPAVIAYSIACLTGKKFIYDERGLMAEEYADGGMWKRDGFIYKTVRSIEKRLLLRADAVVVLTENIKRFLTDGSYLTYRGKSLNIHVIPCCVDIERFAPAPRDKLRLREKIRSGLGGKFIFIYTGSLGTWYMLEEMLDFYVAARSAVPEAYLLVVTHVDREAVRAAWSRRGFSSDDITITGTEFADMPDYLNAADAGMFFIRPVLSKRSSCPIKFAEYLACGLPVVINGGIGDTADIVETNRVGVVVRGFSRDEYDRAARSIIALAKEDDTMRRCRLIAEKEFSLGSGIGKYERIYESAVSLKKGRE